MPKNRRKTTNVIEVGSMAKWVVLFVIIAALGLSYVSIKTRHHAYGREQKALEKSLKELQKQNEVYAVQIEHWSSRAMLQRRVNEGFISMIPISHENIVRLKTNTERPGIDELRAVSNQVVTR